MRTDRVIQVVCGLAAAAMLAAAGLLHAGLEDRRRSAALSDPATEAALRANPQFSALPAVPGGLRVLFVNYLWMRSQKAHQEGRHYDANQLAEMICQLQPHFDGVWIFHAWNMAWNISVTCHTREERWRWIDNGISLLRDRALPLNPRSRKLYQELSWIFLSKVGGQIDEMHESYKQRWAGEMQRLLGAPVFDAGRARSLEDSTRRVIDAFRPIAEAPLDKDLTRRGRRPIQADQLAALLAGNPAARAYAARLARLDVRIDESLLAAYNRFSRDDAVAVIRVQPPRPDTPRDNALFDLINDPASAAARSGLLAFVRAQLLWNRYNMDPAEMLALMEEYDAPLDWRHAVSHALYWAALGMKRRPPKDLTEVDTLNHNRNILNALKDLTFRGLIVLQERPEDPQYPAYSELPDLRYVAPTHARHVMIAEEQIAATDPNRLQSRFEENYYDSGHVNYLIDCCKMLYADGRTRAAQGYFDWLKEKYKREGPQWEMTRVEDFIRCEMREDPHFRYSVAVLLLQFSLKRAYLDRGLRSDEQAYRDRLRYAVRVYDAYQKKSVDRLKLPEPFSAVAASVLLNLLGRPQLFGVNLSLLDRSAVYNALRDQPDIQRPAYHVLEGFLRRQCDDEGVRFGRAFPAPPGLEAYRNELRRKMTEQQPDRVIRYYTSGCLDLFDKLRACSAALRST
jgi:hypothetical protein